MYRQYDSTVRTNTVIGPGGDAAILRIRGTSKALALTTDCNGRYCYLDPCLGARIAVAEAARNVACAGARPRAITNNLNFGNPRKPEVYHQLREAIAGIAEACEALGTPVTGGNVSLYNEHPGGAVYPTPVIGMVGVVESLDHVTPATFSHDGDEIVLLGEPTNELGGSEYLKTIHGIVAGAPPECDLARERALIEALLEAIALGAVRSAHDCSDGGFAVALAESAIMDRNRPMGASSCRRTRRPPWSPRPADTAFPRDRSARCAPRARCASAWVRASSNRASTRWSTRTTKRFRGA